MITIIHGSDTASSRKYFFDEKSRKVAPLLLTDDQINITDLTQILEGGGLFGESKYIFIEQLYTKKKKSSDFKDILSYLDKNSIENNIYIWEGRDLEPSNLKFFKNAQVKSFKLPQTLFLLLDSLKPGNGKILVSLFHQTLANADIEMVFFMLVRQVRLMLAVVNTGNDNIIIDDLKRVSPWQMQKIQRQASLFHEDELLILFSKLYEIEIGQKTGTLKAPITAVIDFLLIEV